MSLAHASRGRLRSLAAVTLGIMTATFLAACGGGGDSEGDPNSIKVWIQEDLPDRVAATQKIVDAFSEESGVQVELVSVGEDKFNQLLTSSAAAGDLPDVIGGISLAQVRTMSGNELLDTESTASIMESLDAGTFSEPALELTRDGDTQLAVPSESWIQLLVYRKDLFEKAGLDAPETYDSILAAAEELDSGDTAGFVGANISGDAFTEQTFEQVALGNDCQLVEGEEVTLDSPECVEAFEFYGQLIEDYSVPGGQDVDTTRAAYFAGKASMLIWSTFILDEMAGLRDDALPNCPECKKDPAYLAKNSGVATAFAGPSGSDPRGFGEITSWVVPAEASGEPAQQFIEYMMSDGYMDWIAIAPEGKVPVRAGTPDNPEEYAEGWAELDMGVDTKAPMSEFYEQEVIDALATGPESITRWAIPQGQGDLLGALQGEMPVADAVNKVTSGEDAQTVATEAADSVREIQSTMP